MSTSPRACGSCTLCCKVLKIPVLNKPARQWCVHCKTSKGCTDYENRPQVCRDFYCLYISGGAALGEHWFPARSKMIVISDPSIPRIEVQLDGERRDAWKAEPFYSEIKAWSRAALRDGGQVMICLPDRTIVVLPDKDVDVGKLEESDRLLWSETMSPSGPVIGIEKVSADDPRLRTA